jgi:hypothetical protein
MTMRRTFLIFAKWLIPFLVLPPALAFGQFTTVTGTVIDPNGIPYSQGTITAQLVIAGVTPTLNGGGFSMTGSAGLDNSGNFTMRLVSSTSMSPNLQWSFTVCSAKGTVNPAIGTGSQCFTPAAITITGSSQSISTQLQAAALALTNTTGSAPCPTCVTETGTNTAGNVMTGAGSRSIQDSGTALSSLAPLASPALTGIPTAPTAAPGTSTTQLATTAFVAASAAAGVTSFSGDGALLSNTLSTGAVTATLANAGARSVWGNTSSSAGAPGYTNSPVLVNLTATDGSTYNDTYGGNPSIKLYNNGAVTFYSASRARGTISAPAAVQAGDVLGGLGGQGYNGTSFGSSLGMSFFAAETWSAGANGAYIDFQSIPTGSTLAAVHQLFEPGGSSDFGTPAPTSAGVSTGTAYASFDLNGNLIKPESTAPSGIASSDISYADSILHRWIDINNNGAALMRVGVTAAKVAGNCAQFAANGIDLADSGSTNCGGGGSGANTALSNLAAVAVNLPLLPGVDNSIALNDATHRYTNAFFTALNCGIAGTTSCVITMNGSTSGSATFTAPAVAGTVTNGVTISNVLLAPNGDSAHAAYGFTANPGTGIFNSGGQLFLKTEAGLPINVSPGAFTTWVYSSSSGALLAQSDSYAIQAGKYQTVSNCANGASPAVCGAAPAGAVAVPTGTNPALVINTTAVTANSRIWLQIDESSTIAATTCNTTLSTLVQPVVTARIAGTSFTIQIGAVIATNPVCVSYLVFN